MRLELSKRRPWWMTPFGREPLGDIFFDRLYPEWRRDMGEELDVSVDFSDKDGKYYLKAELPGIKKEDINVEVKDGYVTVSGKKEETSEKKDTDYYLKETKSGSFSRSFRLYNKVDEDKIEANYKDGVLTVIIPYAETKERKKIEIH